MILEYFIIFSLTTFFQLILLLYIEKKEYKVNIKIKTIAPIIAGTISLIIFYRYGRGLEIIKYILITEVILTITAVDITVKLIPDRLNATLLIIGFINLLISKEIYSSILAFLLSGLLFLGLALITGGIGGGDIKLIAPLGLIFGIIPTLYLICYSFIIAGVISIILMLGKKAKIGTEIALAPYISIATIIIILGPVSQLL